MQELTRWYQEKNLEGKKHTLEEWKLTMDFVKSRASHRRDSSKTTRQSSTANRANVETHLGGQAKLVNKSFMTHLSEQGVYKRQLTEMATNLAKEVLYMKQAISKLEAWIAARTKWPIKVNKMCMHYRDQRIGIDLVMDKTEIELAKEFKMLTTVVEANTADVLHSAYEALAELELCQELLSNDLRKKTQSNAIDAGLNKLQPSANLGCALDVIILRPADAIEVQNWRETTATLVQRAADAIEHSKQLRDQMTAAAEKSDVVVREFAEAVDVELHAKLTASVEARDEVYGLLMNTKEELARAANEVDTLQPAIDAKLRPLAFSTSRLDARRSRPESEKTIDVVHESLIQEVAEIDAAVSALQLELSTMIENTADLKTMEAVLEEDYGIKKCTVQLEKRCVRVRSFLASDADIYIVDRMLVDDDFFDLMTR